MLIACLSDIHGRWKDIEYPKADILVLCGDILENYSWNRSIDAELQLQELNNLDCFLGKKGFRKIFLVSGNHEWCSSHKFAKEEIRKQLRNLKNITYLEDEEVIFEGLKIFGSPHQPEFFDWNFNVKRNSPELKALWDKIPLDVDILLTHSPAYGTLDQIDYKGEGRDKEHLGCELLRDKIKELKSLKLHVFGHIHGGAQNPENNTNKKINAAICNEKYEPVNPIQVFDLEVK